MRVEAIQKGIRLVCIGERADDALSGIESDGSEAEYTAMIFVGPYDNEARSALVKEIPDLIYLLKFDEWMDGFAAAWSMQTVDIYRGACYMMRPASSGIVADNWQTALTGIMGALNEQRKALHSVSVR